MPSKDQRRTTVDIPRRLHQEAVIEGAKHEIFAWRQIVIASLELWLAVKQGKLHIVSDAVLTQVELGEFFQEEQ